MKQIDTYRFEADENKTFVNRETGVRFGHNIYLPLTDSIENYIEEEMTEEEKRQIEKEKERFSEDKKDKKMHR